MGHKYTLDQVKKAISDNGLYFSDADYGLAESNPDAGMTIVNSKIDYKNADTDEQRALANARAEQTRKDYGNYSGGTDGSSFYLFEPTPQSYTKEEYTNPYEDKMNATVDKIMNQREWQNPYAEQVQSAYDKVANRADYTDKYEQQKNDLINALQNRGEWSYDANNDQAYQAARKQYLREADRATQDTIGQAAALTGGIASTAAVNAASQAGDYYRTQLSDQLANYIDADYNRYQNDIDTDMSLLNQIYQLSDSDFQHYLNQAGLDFDTLSAINDMTESEYQRFIDEVGLDFDTLSALRSLSQDARDQYDTDRNFEYGQWTDDLGFRNEEEQTEYEKKQYDKEYADAKEADSFEQQADLYQMYLALYEQTQDSTYKKKAAEILSALNNK